MQFCPSHMMKEKEAKSLWFKGQLRKLMGNHAEGSLGYTTAQGHA